MSGGGDLSPLQSWREQESEKGKTGKKKERREWEREAEVFGLWVRVSERQRDAEGERERGLFSWLIESSLSFAGGNRRTAFTDITQWPYPDFIKSFPFQTRTHAHSHTHVHTHTHTNRPVLKGLFVVCYICKYAQTDAHKRTHQHAAKTCILAKPQPGYVHHACPMFVPCSLSVSKHCYQIKTLTFNTTLSK